MKHAGRDPGPGPPAPVHGGAFTVRGHRAWGVPSPHRPQHRVLGRAQSPSWSPAHLLPAPTPPQGTGALRPRPGSAPLLLAPRSRQSHALAHLQRRYLPGLSTPPGQGTPRARPGSPLCPAEPPPGACLPPMPLSSDGCPSCETVSPSARPHLTGGQGHSTQRGPRMTGSRARRPTR